jgi:VCBS repeat-containing protein
MTPAPGTTPVTVSASDGTRQIDITHQWRERCRGDRRHDDWFGDREGGGANGTPGVATANGTLSATDVDSPATFVAQTNAAEGHGTFSISSAGARSYTLDDNNASVQALGAGGTLHDLVPVATADGTTRW